MWYSVSTFVLKCCLLELFNVCNTVCKYSMLPGKKLDGNFEGKMFLSEGNMCIITQTACIVLGLFRE